MAEYTYPPQGGAFHHDPSFETMHGASANTLTSLANIAGALLSLALIVGIGVWGYKLLVRDVSGIPVVRVAEGETRVRPEDPGGRLAQNQGLSVNAIAARGVSDPAAQPVQLAPGPVDLTAEDKAVAPPRVTTLPQEAVPILPPEPLDLTDELRAAITPPAAVQPADTPQEVTAVAQDQETELQRALLEAPGVKLSLRPKKRPAQRAGVTTLAASPEALSELDAARLPVGTRLAQIGAFDSAEIARQQWDVFERRFSVYMQDKKRIIQKSTSGGRVFYRLRVHGFSNGAEARRFCSALVAENADCIPVVLR
ncbi:MAG: SPOR domain-containing protein [Pseudomonadota bacterium]